MVSTEEHCFKEITRNTQGGMEEHSLKFIIVPCILFQNSLYSLSLPPFSTFHTPLFFETSSNVAQVGLELALAKDGCELQILWHAHLKCHDYKDVPPHLASNLIIQFKEKVKYLDYCHLRFA